MEESSTPETPLPIPIPLPPPKPQRSSRILLAVPKPLVKTIKDALQACGKLDRSRKIQPLRSDCCPRSSCPPGTSQSQTPTSQRVSVQATRTAVAAAVAAAEEEKEERYLIPTTFTTTSTAIPHLDEEIEEEEKLLESLPTTLNLPPATTAFISLYFHPLPPLPPPSPHLHYPPKSPLSLVLQKWLLSLPSPPLGPAPVPLPHAYTIYSPLLLLPQNTFTLAPWPALLAPGGRLVAHVPVLWAMVCREMGVTHVALQGRVPATVSSTTAVGEGDIDAEAEGDKEEYPQPANNILRLPDLHPLYNDFGPVLPPSHVPTQADFARAFWCTARQNGILQTWAPRQTMFSRGNVSEKARLLRLLGRATATRSGDGGEEEGQGKGREKERSSAVDLYAGVGYFAFCYVRAGVEVVLCWELSGWSVEGLRRGAGPNGWGVAIFGDSERERDDGVGLGKGEGEDERAAGEGKQPGKNAWKHSGERLLVFHESNQRAAARIEAMRAQIPPVRHVNCGFLPSSEASWGVAVRVLDPAQGGWIHAHENIAVSAFERRTEEIARVFRGLVQQQQEQEEQQQRQRERGGGGKGPRRVVKCVHFEQVKGYAPGVVHCVLDISIMPLVA